MNFPAHLIAALLASQAALGPSRAPDPGSGWLHAAKTALPTDSLRTHRRARTLQARFERQRIRALPRTPGGGSHECDEIIGRLCIWDDGDGDWTPKDEPAAIVEARAELLAGLGSLAALVPGDHWIFGQRIRYLVEGGHLDEAEELARTCGLLNRWRCDAYLGFVHHHQTNFGLSETAFRRSLDAMPADVRDDWASPRPVLGRELRRWLSEQPDSAAALARLWTLADPLFIAEGNDRWTAHMSRWSYAMSADRARNPYEINWGKDFTEVVVRYGWPIAWERSWPRVGQSSVTVTGRDLPMAFRTFPPREVLARGPSGEEPIVWEVPERHPRSSHFPRYLDSLGVLEAQAGRFWRRDHVVVVGAWTAPGEQEAAGSDSAAHHTVLSGLFVEQGGALGADVRTVADPGSPVRLSTRVPWADWGVLSLEAWAPGLRRAYRLRAGMGFRKLPPDLFTLSDLVLLETGGEPNTFAEMTEVLRTSHEFAAGEPLNVALEIYGLGFRSEAVGFIAWVQRRDEGFLTRVGRWLRLAGPREEVSIGWQEAGPDVPEPLFRAFRIGVPTLDPGEYEVVVEVSVRGRSPLRARRGFSVR